MIEIQSLNKALRKPPCELYLILLFYSTLERHTSDASKLTLFACQEMISRDPIADPFVHPPTFAYSSTVAFREIFSHSVTQLEVKWCTSSFSFSSTQLDYCCKKDKRSNHGPLHPPAPSILPETTCIPRRRTLWYAHPTRYPSRHSPLKTGAILVLLETVTFRSRPKDILDPSKLRDRVFGKLWLRIGMGWKSYDCPPRAFEGGIPNRR